MTSYKLCFAELQITYQSMIDFTYCFFITNDYIFPVTTKTIL